MWYDFFPPSPQRSFPLFHFPFYVVRICVGVCAPSSTAVPLISAFCTWLTATPAFHHSSVHYKNLSFSQRLCHSAESLWSVSGSRNLQCVWGGFFPPLWFLISSSNLLVVVLPCQSPVLTACPQFSWLLIKLFNLHLPQGCAFRFQLPIPHRLNIGRLISTEDRILNVYQSLTFQDL